MSTAVTGADTPSAPSRQALAAQNRSLPGRVTGRLRKAIDAMVWDAASRPEAAQIAGMTDHSLRQALRRPHVMAFYRGECEVLRMSGRARRIHRLGEVVEQKENKMAVVQAAKALEQIVDEQAARGAGVQRAGLVIVIYPASDHREPVRVIGPPPVKTIDGSLATDQHALEAE
jgi:hypothetical protein